MIGPPGVVLWAHRQPLARTQCSKPAIEIFSNTHKQQQLWMEVETKSVLAKSAPGRGVVLCPETNQVPWKVPENSSLGATRLSEADKAHSG